MLAWVLNTPLLFEDSSNVLFFKRIFHYKAPEICSILLFFKVLLLLIHQTKNIRELSSLTSLIKHAEHLILKKDFIST